MQLLCKGMVRRQPLATRKRVLNTHMLRFPPPPEQQSAAVVPEGIAADMFMLIQQRTHHWMTFCSVAPSNLESVIRRVAEQANMVRTLGPCGR